MAAEEPGAGAGGGEPICCGTGRQKRLADDMMGGKEEGATHERRKR